MKNDIEVVGIVRLSGTGSDHIHLQDYVYSELGLSPTLTARDYKSPRMILVRKNYEPDKQ